MYQKGDPLVFHLACVHKPASATIKPQARWKKLTSHRRIDLGI